MFWTHVSSTKGSAAKLFRVLSEMSPNFPKSYSKTWKVNIISAAYPSAPCKEHNYGLNIAHLVIHKADIVYKYSTGTLISCTGSYC